MTVGQAFERGRALVAWLHAQADDFKKDDGGGLWTAEAYMYRRRAALVEAALKTKDLVRLMKLSVKDIVHPCGCLDEIPDEYHIKPSDLLEV